MIEQDYVMRLISMLTTMLARILFFKQKKEFPQALLEIQNTGKTLVGIDRSLIIALSAPQLMDLFGSDVTVALPKSYVLGILLKEEADIRLLVGEQDESDQLYLKSLYLLIDTLLKAGEPMEPRHTQLADDLLHILNGCALPEELLKKILHYQEYRGRYDRAEDTLYDILALNPDFVQEGLQFYRRLLVKSDDDLEAGKFPRNEVREGIAELERKSTGPKDMPC
jgi:hypothetical protein